MTVRALLVEAQDRSAAVVGRYLRSAGAEPVVVSAAALEPDVVPGLRADVIVLGPGIGHPMDSGYVQLVRRFADTVPILGFCVGHEALALAFGGSIVPDRQLAPGRAAFVDHDGAGVFTGLASPIRTAAGHWLTVDPDQVPDCLRVTAVSRQPRRVMGLRHRHRPVETVQFHPDSVPAEQGRHLVRAFLDSSVTVDRCR